MPRAAALVQAMALMAGFEAFGCMAADAAEPMALMPPDQTAGVGEQGPILLAEQRAGGPEVDERPDPRPCRVGVGVVRGADVDGQVRDAVDKSEQDDLRCLGAPPILRGRQHHRPGRVTRAGDQVLGPPDRQHPGVRIGQVSFQERRIAAALGVPVDAAMDVEIAVRHGRAR